MNALVQQLELYQTGDSQHTDGTETLEQLIHIYAPTEDNNNPENYATFVANELGVDITVPIRQLDSTALAKAITKFESPQMYKKIYGQ